MNTDVTGGTMDGRGGTNGSAGFVPDADVLSRYLLGLPLPEGVNRLQVAASIRRDPETAEIYRGVREDLAGVMDLRYGWFGWKGALLAARQRGRVSADERLQRAWEHHLSELPAIQARVAQATSLLHPAPAQAWALAACCVMVFFAGRLSESTPFPSAGSKAIPGNGSGWVNTQDALERLTEPESQNLTLAIAFWVRQQAKRPNDLAVRHELFELYDRLLNDPQAIKTLTPAELAQYRRDRAATATWLLQHPFQITPP